MKPMLGNGVGFSDLYVEWLEQQLLESGTEKKCSFYMNDGTTACNCKYCGKHESIH